MATYSSPYGPSPRDRRPSEDDCAICLSTWMSGECEDCGKVFCGDHRAVERNNWAVLSSICTECAAWRSARSSALISAEGHLMELREQACVEENRHIFTDDAKVAWAVLGDMLNHLFNEANELLGIDARYGEACFVRNETERIFAEVWS
jgi:hypothetical protein